MVLPGANTPWVRRALALVLAVAVLAGGWLLLRDASFLRVRDVFITGVDSSEEVEVRKALREAARGMTTLNVSEAALRRAVRGFPSVAELEADADLPRKLTIVVREREPVATLAAGPQRVPVTGRGRLLRGLRTGPLPTVEVRTLPPGEQVTDRGALAALAVAGATPAPLRPRVAVIGRGARGLELELRSGPPLVFGSAARAHAKWAAAARVLAEPDAAGATYLDVRVPERVAAGGLGPVTTPQTQPQAVPEGG